MNKTPPMSLDAMDDKLIAAAYRHVERQFDEGTATSQLSIHFIELGSKKADVQLRRAELELRLLDAKIASELAQSHHEEELREVLDALQRYSPGYSHHDKDYD